ncbi:MAG: HDOD domain-containing protein [Gammaproteobacteria bacterium]|nr:HDOD domain-containing protein [Gammaproteobacteria bacterium]MCW8910069.1 HDOD domain-containing protein [Gammaproteobacteria bacterium]MCW9004821.1 HDOD domain-containing protein [Gammaproteobacteria bacterium]MCW9055179.1 HDOD domain-containing protein [Gammaproteobacteria bacterium]
MLTSEQLISRSVKLISLPDVYVRLKSVMNTPNSSMSDIAMVIAHDPALTARLLKLVNSPFYGFAANIDTVTHAINLLGTEQVEELVFATTIVNSLTGFSNDTMNMYDFWFKSVYCAVTARLLAFTCDDMDTERPFVTGLLHDIGHLIMYCEIPDECRPAIVTAEEKQLDLYIAERDVLGFDYAQVGSDLLSSWGLPASLIEIIGCQNEPVRADKYQMETAILHIAIAITKAALAEMPVSPDTLMVDPICWDITGLSVNEMPEIKSEVDDQASLGMDILFPRLSSTTH